MVKIAVIGGSGLDNPDVLKKVKKIVVNTRFGSVSLKEGVLDETKIYILARHGEGHETTPTNVNYRANILALKSLGVTHILATTAVGSLREDIKPGDLVFPSQYIDFTKQRKLSFYEDSVVHTSLADPYCPALRQLASIKAKELGIIFHSNKTLVTIEGPRFSTRSESHMFRAIGADVINMSGVPEAQLAREAGICYLSIAMSTDYDCWKVHEQAVTFDMILSIMRENAEKVIKLIREMVTAIKAVDCKCESGFNVSLNRQLKETIIGQFAVKPLEDYVRSIPNFPKKGILFRDITTLVKDKVGFKLAVDKLTEIYKDKNIDKFVGIESRGFIFASALAYNLSAGLALARKPNKLPAKKIAVEYSLEYGKDKIEMHKDAIRRGEKVVIVDDLIATGGTAKACGKLVKHLGGKLDSYAFVIDLPDLGGKEKLKPHKIYTLMEFPGH